MSETRMSITERLNKLEACHKNIASLEKDVAFLQRDLCREQRENAELKSELTTLKRQMKRNERISEERISQLEVISQVLNRALVKAHENVDSRQEVMGSLQKLQLDSKTSHHHTERRLDKLETDCARNRQSVSDKIGNLETCVLKRLEEVEDIVKTQSRKVSKLVEEFETRGPEERLSAQACAPPSTPRTSTPSAPTQSTPTPNTPTQSTPTPNTPTQSTPTPNTPTQSTPTPNTPTQSTPPAPPAKNLTPEEWDCLKETSFFGVEMSLPRTIQGRTRQMVEGYDRVHKDSDCFDSKTGVYKTPVFGPYIFAVDRWMSTKDGGVKYYLCGGDGRRKEVLVSRESDGGWRQWDNVDWDCPEGLEVWVEVEAGRGGDGLTYKVVFFGCLTK